MKQKVNVLIAPFLKSETGPLTDFSVYVDWLSPQWSPITPPSPVQSSETRLTDWQSCTLCGGHNTTERGNSGLNSKIRLSQLRSLAKSLCPHPLVPVWGGSASSRQTERQMGGRKEYWTGSHRRQENTYNHGTKIEMFFRSHTGILAYWHCRIQTKSMMKIYISFWLRELPIKKMQLNYGFLP